MAENNFSTRFSTLKRQAIESDFPNLNRMQLKAVCISTGPLLILAGAGSGKTTVLINRIANILKYGSGYECPSIPQDITEQDLELLHNYIYNKKTLSDDEKSICVGLCANAPAKPWEILAITFTNKAAGELKERLISAIGENAKNIWAQTFHSACMRILRRDIENLGYRPNFTIYDEDDKKKVLTEILAELNLDQKRFDPRVISGEISHSKDNLMDARQYCKENQTDFFRKIVGEIYTRYEKRLFTANALDFDDIIVKTVDLFNKFPEVLSYYQQKFKYILIDEYQDTNHAQYELTRLLADVHRNICAVGDDDQGIYKFRGASIENILHFEKNYDYARILRLEQNYRSTQHILDAAGGVISNNKGRKGKTLWTENGNGEQVYIINAGNEEGEAYEISYRILKAVENGAKMSDFAVLYRNNVLSQPIEMSFKRSAIPYRIISGKGFFERAEVKDMLSYLWVINNNADDLRLKRIINNPARKISDKTVVLLEQFASENNCSLFEIAITANKYPDLSRVSTALLSFSQMILSLKTLSQTITLPEFYNAVIEQTGYVASLQEKKDDDSKKRIENVLELSSLFVEYCGRTAEPTLEGFLEEISLFTSIDKYDEETDAVSLMTIHSAKGLEFTNVFVCGMEDTIFPGFKATEHEEDLEEERRLCYVAMTRAKRRLYLTSASRRLLYGQTKYSTPSRFLSEIPAQCISPESETVKASLYPSRGGRLVSSEYGSTQKRSSTGDSMISNSFSSGRAAALQASNSYMYNGTLTSQSKPEKVSSSVASYAIGDTVEHRAFGKGMVTMATFIAGDTLLEIAFDKVGTKKLMANSASQFMKKM